MPPKKLQAQQVDEDNEALSTYTGGAVAERLPRLKDHERSLVRRYFERGASALLEDRMNAESINEFLGRKAVKSELARLKELYSNRELLDERARFMMHLDAVRLIPRAMAIITMAMMKPKDLEKLGEEPPTKMNLEAADRVFKIMGASKPYGRVGDDEGEALSAEIMEQLQNEDQKLATASRAKVMKALKLLNVSDDQVEELKAFLPTRKRRKKKRKDRDVRKNEKRHKRKKAKE